ncbi:MAG: LbtU family siderophore porin [Candidatus Thiodiazotropha sp.]
MKNSTLFLMVSTLLTIPASLLARTPEERIDEMEQRLKTLEQQEPTRHHLDIEPLEAPDEEKALEESLLDRFVFNGVIEVEAQQISPDEGDNSSDLYLPTLELGVAAQVNDWTSAEIVLLYEDDGTHSGDFAVDSGVIRIADPQASWYMEAGQYGLPFGDFSTHMISDPLTLDAAETYDVALEAGYEFSGARFALYVFKGDQQDEISNGGLYLGYSLEHDDLAFTTSFGWINDLSESDSVVDEGSAALNKAPAWTLFAQLDWRAFSLIGEYLAAREALDVYNTQDKPAFYNLEAAYHFELVDRPVTLAVGWQGSNEARYYADGMDEKRALAAFSLELADSLNVALEVARKEDYDGARERIITAQLAVGF